MKLTLMLVLLPLIGGGCSTDAFSKESNERLQKQVASRTGHFPKVTIGMKYADLVQQIKDGLVVGDGPTFVSN